MKNLILLWTLLLSVSLSFSQKKPAPKAVGPLAKTDNVTAELIGNTMYIFAGKTGVKDTLSKKAFSDKLRPVDVKISKFTAKGAPLYSVSWKEVNTTESKLRKEIATTTCTEIRDPTNKGSVFSNSQTTVNITEIRYLDKNQTVSETVDKVRREGMELTLLPDGDIVLKNKAQESRLTYNSAERKYVASGSGKK
jgi:hypothetical protein